MCQALFLFLILRTVHWNTAVVVSGNVVYIVVHSVCLWSNNHRVRDRILRCSATTGAGRSWLGLCCHISLDFMGWAAGSCVLLLYRWLRGTKMMFRSLLILALYQCVLSMLSRYGIICSLCTLNRIDRGDLLEPRLNIVEAKMVLVFRKWLFSSSSREYRICTQQTIHIKWSVIMCNWIAFIICATLSQMNNPPTITTTW